MAHFCKNCGLLTAPYDERCPKCGAPLPHIPMGEALLESMRQSPEGTVETGEPLYEQDLEEDRIDAMSQGATTAAMLLFAIPIAGFVLAVVWIPLFIYTKKVYTPAVEKEPTGIEWRYLWLIPATFYLIWYYMLYNNNGKSSLETALDAGNAVFLLFINVGAGIVYYVIAMLINEQEKNIRLSDNNHRLAMQNLQYENLQEKIADARRAKHDVRHHISLMQEYVRNKQYEELEKYLNSYQQSLPDDTLISFCENKTVNAVMLYFAQVAKNEDIDYDVKAVIPENISVDETDLSVLFGNLIENATDACREESGDNRRIVIRAMTDEYTLCLGIDNTFTGTLKKDLSGVLFSSKHKGFGVGVESVKSIAEKYGGTYCAEVKDEMFMSSVLLNLRT